MRQEVSDRERKSAETSLRIVSALFVAFFLFSILAVSLHHHADLRAQVNYLSFKFADDLSSGNNVESPSLTVPEFVSDYHLKEIPTFFVSGENFEREMAESSKELQPRIMKL